MTSHPEDPQHPGDPQRGSNPPYGSQPSDSPTPGLPYPGQPHAGAPYPGRPYEGPGTTGQPYAGESQTDRPHAGPAHTGQPQTGQPHTGPPYAGQSQTGQPETGQPYTSQPYSGQRQTGPPYPGQPYPGQPYAGPATTAQPTAKRSRRRAPLFIAAVAAVALVAGAGGAAIGTQFGGHSTTLTNLAGSTGTSTVVSPAASNTVSAVAAKAIPSVVTIQVRNGQQGATGSGVIVRTDGLIVTNNHVVAAAQGGTMTVEFSDGRQASATLVGADPTTDLAVIRVKGVDNLQAATFANSDNVVVGELVVAIGSPLGLDGTVTSGVVSAVNRPVSTGDSNSTQAVIDAIQTDAPINPGNSGGPLLDAQGQVIGINSAIATTGSGGGTSALPSSQPGNIGVGFAIPSDTVKQIAGQLIDKGVATHAQLGVEASDVADTTTAGAQIRTVGAGGPAAQAGLQPGDIITQLDGRTIEDVDTLVVAVHEHSPGDTVSISYLRGGEQHTASATLVAAPQS